jgi:replicative DNA helicase
MSKGINKNMLKRGELGDADQQKVRAFLQEVQENKIRFVMEHRSYCTVYDIEALIERHKPDVVFVDYLGLMDGHKNYFKSSNEIKEKMRDISKELKQLAVKFEIPVVAVHQSNRDFDEEKGKLPSLKNLADSDDIGRNADKVYAVHQTAEQKELNEMIIGTVKVRDAKDATIVCDWDLDLGKVGSNPRYYNDSSIEGKKQEPDDGVKIPF